MRVVKSEKIGSCTITLFNNDKIRIAIWEQGFVTDKTISGIGRFEDGLSVFNDIVSKLEKRGDNYISSRIVRTIYEGSSYFDKLDEDTKKGIDAKCVHVPQFIDIIDNIEVHKSVTCFESEFALNDYDVIPDHSEELSKLDILSEHFHKSQINKLKATLEHTLFCNKLITKNIPYINSTVNQFNINYVYELRATIYNCLGYNFAFIRLRGQT